MDSFGVKDAEGYDEDVAEQWYTDAIAAYHKDHSLSAWSGLKPAMQDKYVKAVQVMRGKKHPRPAHKHITFDFAVHHHLSDEEVAEAWHTNNCSQWPNNTRFWHNEPQFIRDNWIKNAKEFRAKPEIILKTQALKEKEATMKFNTPQFVSHRSCRPTTGETNGKNDQKEKLRS